MKQVAGKRRRGTILLMIVGLLAMLFIIVAAYITLARSDRAALVQYQRGEQREKILDATTRVLLQEVRNSLLDASGRPLHGGEQRSKQEVDALLMPYAGTLEPVPPHQPRTGYSAETIPGADGTEWLASLEPVMDPGVRLADPDRDISPGSIQWPAISRFGSNRPARLRMSETFRDYNRSGAAEVDPTIQTVPTVDLRLNSSQVFLDADGDGIPDSDFVASGILTQIANSLAGRPVRLPRDRTFSPSNLAAGPIGVPPDARAADLDAFERFDETAPYEVSARIVAHGGMVALDSPAGGPNTNRDFTLRMMQWLLHHRDGRLSFAGTGLLRYDNDAIFRQIARESSATEAQLRHRGGLLRSYDTTQEPDALRLLAASYPYTFVNNLFRLDSVVTPTGLARKPNNWQRFNLTNYAWRQDSPNEWRAWHLGRILDPTEFIAAGGDPSLAPAQNVLQPYVRRGLITTVSYSDEIARDLAPTRPLEPPMTPPAPRGVEPGQLKFYLGKLTPNPETGTLYVPPNLGPAGLVYNRARGQELFNELVDYYSEMLSASGGWRTNPGDTTSPEATGQLQQACMLAINTIAFGTPRWSSSTAGPGYVDLVMANGPDGHRYYGVGPQPVITEVIAYRRPGPPADDGTGGPTGASETPVATDVIAVAVELYNPNDPSPDVMNDAQALWLGQFALSIDNGPRVPLRNVVATPAGSTTAVPIERLGGRQFLTIVLENAAQNDFFRLRIPGIATFATPLALPGLQVESTTSGSQMKVRLWRGNDTRLYLSSGTPPADEWVVVDELELDRPDKRPAEFETPTSGGGTGQTGGEPPGGTGIEPGGGTGAGEPPEWPGSWSHAWRDTSYETQWGRWLGYYGPGGPAGSTIDPAGGGSDPSDPSGGGGGGGVGADDEPVAPRWRAMLAFEQGESGYRSNQGDRSTPEVTSLNHPRPIAPAAIAPSAPQYTMNSPTGVTRRIHGVDRPNSFPTVGFLLFVSRYAPWLDGTLEPTIPGDPAPPDAAYVAYEPATRILARQWERNRRGGASGYNYNLANYPPDFGHMPLVKADQPVLASSYFGNSHAGPVPWGMLVFDYFTTHRHDPSQGVDLYRIPGRIDVNTAPWFLLAGLPVIGPAVGGPYNDQLLLHDTPLSGWNLNQTTTATFWNPYVGGLVGEETILPARRFPSDLVTAPASDRTLLRESALLTPDGLATSWRLGPQLAASMAAYRDRLAYMDNSALTLFPAAQTRPGDTRGAGKRGFVTLGELAAVPGFDFANPATGMPGGRTSRDFLRTVSLVALLDTHFLATRSNTFTAYLTLSDRENPDRSLHTQVTFDRSNLLPRLVTEPGPGGATYSIYANELPRVVAERQLGYYATQAE